MHVRAFLTCFRLAVFSGLPVLPVFAKIILEGKRFLFFAPNFPYKKISRNDESRRWIQAVRKIYKMTSGLKASACCTTWLSGIRLRSCIDILTSIQSGAQQATGRASGSLIYDVLLQTAPQSHLLQTKPSPPLQGVPHQKAPPWLHKNPQRWGDFYDGAT